MATEKERIAVVESRVDNHEKLFVQQNDKLDGISGQLTEVQTTMSASVAHNKHLANSIKEAKQQSSVLPNIILTAVIAVLISSVFGIAKSSIAEATQPSQTQNP